ncbi:TPA: hypothetical protein KEW61_000084 [Escherichia coli]|nr:hypothetical protein [Escherichia coli]
MEIQSLEDVCSVHCCIKLSTFPIFVNFQIYRLKQVSDMKALLITALFMGFISVNNASAAEEIHHADGKVDDQVLIAE